jgi:PEGA domain
MSSESGRYRDGQVPNRDASGSVDPKTLEAPLKGVPWTLDASRAQESTAEAAGALLAFASEDPRPRETTSPTHQHTRMRPSSAWMFAASAGVLAIIGIGAATRIRERPAPLQAASHVGKLTVNTDPAGADVEIDGQSRGATPLNVTLEAGTHSMTVRRNGIERAVPISIAAGSDLTQFLEIGASVSAVPVTGQITVVTNPAGARVTIDGATVGVSPATIQNVTPTRHVVAVFSDAGSGERVVSVEPGGTTSIVFELPKSSGGGAGWLAIAAPFDVQVLESGEIVGSSDTAKIMMPAGRHNLVVANGDLQYEESRKVDVVAGKVATLRIEPPKVSLSVNARPWADVAIDAKDVGQTPLSNLLVPIGRHEITFRHPQLGERRQTVVVTTRGPNRVAADMNK